MMIGFIVWTAIAIAIAVIGIIAGRSKKPSGFFAGVNPPEVNDVEKYNRSVGTLWIVYAILLELFGLPLLLLKQNSAGFIVSILGVVFISIGLGVAYTFIVARYRK